MISAGIEYGFLTLGMKLITSFCLTLLPLSTDDEMTLILIWMLGHTFDPERNEEFFRRHIASDEDPDKSDQEIPTRESRSFVHDDANSSVHREDIIIFIKES